jgi:hypothetical protein
LALINIRANVEPCREYFLSFSGKLGGSLHEIMLRGADIFRDEMFTRAPRGRTSDLANSITIIDEGDRILVGPTSEHAIYVSLGTGPSPGRYVPAIDRRLINPDLPGFGWHPGIRPNPYIEETAAAKMADFFMYCRNELGRVIEGVA